MKTLLLFSMLSFVACNSGQKDNTVTSQSATTAATKLIYSTPITYSSEFSMGDQKNAQVILDLWRDFDNNTISNSAANFADTVTMQFPGMEITTTRDSAVAMTTEYRSGFTKMNSTVGAILPVTSTDKKDDWVLIWGTEVHTDKNNVTDSVHLQETLRFNKAGKIDMMIQFIRTPATSK